MIDEKKPYKRSRYFVKKGFQFTFILKFSLIVLAGVMISTALLLFFSQDTLTSSFNQSRLVVKNTGQAILPFVVYTNLITLVLITLATVIVTLFVSHKIAGPMYRFEEDLRAIGEGDLTKKVMLRKKDQITDMAVSVNNMIAALREKVLDIQTEAEHVLESATRQNAPEGLIEELSHLHQKIGSHFRI